MTGGVTGDAPDGQQVDGAGSGVGATAPDAGAARDRLVTRLVLALLMAPVVVAAVALVVGVGGDYMPASDHALTEMQVRDVGRHEVLVGLYSRADWSHPGPALFYLLAPFYWLTGGASIGLALGALAINGAAIAGMVLVARRHAGLPLLLTTALGSALLVRTLGAEFMHDPWNCYLTVLPFGLMAMLTWAMTCGDGRALPVGAAVATYLAQTHVGFVALALPLLVVGAVGLAVAAGRPWTGLRRLWTTLRRPGLVTAGVLGVMWLPLVVDVAVNAPSNVRKIVEWFVEAEGGAKTMALGWRTLAGQLGGRPEWLTGKQPSAVGGETPFLTSAPLPWLLVIVALAGVALWRWGGGGRRLAAVLGVMLVLGVVAVSRTVGPAFDYRLRWTWVAPMLVTVAAAWAGWRWVVARHPACERWLVGGAVAVLVAVTGVNVTTAATAGTPQEGDSAVMAALMPGVLDAVDGAEGPVVVDELFANGAWYARGIVAQLERHGVEVGVPPRYAQLFGEHRVVAGEAPTELVVATDAGVAQMAEVPGLRLVAEWTGIPEADLADGEQRVADLDDALEAGEVTPEQHRFGVTLVDQELHEDVDATAYRAAVFLAVGDG